MVPRRARLGALCAIILLGCSDPYGGRQEVTGTVTLVGQPLKSGSITFFPLDNQGTQSGSSVTAGVYAVPRQSGLKPGKYRVEITAGDGRTPTVEDAGGPGGSTNIVSVDLIPDDWNAKSKQQVEVKSGEANKFDFAIPRANSPRRR